MRDTTRELAYRAGYEAGLKTTRNTVKVLDVGAAIDELSDIKDQLDDIFKRYYGIAKTIEDSYQEGHWAYTPKDPDWHDKFDQLQGDANIDIQRAGFSVQALVKALDEATS